MNTIKEEELKKCYHCGEYCNGSIHLEDKPFCCEGCKTVYEILDQNNLCNYYQLNHTPGVSRQQQPGYAKKFAYLDDEEIISKLISFRDKEVSKVTFYVPQIHCSSCIFLLENLYRLKAGIHRSVVNFLKREVSITYDNSIISLREVVEGMAAIGYEPHINLNDLERKEKQDHLRRYYLKIGIAFFAFGNMMLLSFPEYLGIDILQESPLRQFFGYLNFLLSLPVVFFCASEFFTSAWAALRQKSLNMDIPLALGILVMFLYSTFEVFTQHGAGYFDTLGSLVLLMLIGRYFQNKTYDTLSFERDYKSYFPVAVTVVNNGHETTIPLFKLRVGDRLLIRNQELIPADSVLMKGSGNIDYSFVTGESAPVACQPGEVIFAGGKHIGSSIEVEVTKEVSHSYLTQLWNDSAFSKPSDDHITSLANQVGRWFTPVVLTIAVAAGAYWMFTDFHRALNAFTAVLIITCPCALSLSSPFTLGNVLRLLGSNRIYLKNAFTVEKLADADTLVFDKTGTLTNTKNAQVTYEGDPLSTYQLQLIRSLVYHSSHPLSRKVYEALKGAELISTHDFRETEGKGIEGWIDENCVRIGAKHYLNNAEQKPATGAADLRHASRVYVGINGKVYGCFVVRNEYRKGLWELIETLQHKNYQLFVVSGDNDAEKNILKKYVAEENLIFHQQPADKLAFVRQLQQQGKKVVMIGDGLNDAGALKQADTGLAISDDVNNFSPACDGIIEATQFERIAALLTYAQRGVNIIKASFVISILYNLIGLFFAVDGTMSPIVAAILMPISSTTIILFTTLASKAVGKASGF